MKFVTDLTFQGYKAILGVDPPFIGMCWWINGLLLPELTVVRGETYYFKVRHYHQLYDTQKVDN